jgi:transcriptional regulator with XRE-family HTH domain
MKNFAEHLKSIRKAKGVTQKQVAEGTGIFERAYQKYEAGVMKPAFDSLIALADYFDVSLDFLVGRIYTVQVKKTKEERS